jgi:hypothetical protein
MNNLENYKYILKEYKHNKNTTIQHWQLRDLIQAVSDNEFYYVYKKTIFRYLTKQKKKYKYTKFKI